MAVVGEAIIRDYDSNSLLGTFPACCTPFVALHCMHMDNNLALGPITWCYGHTARGLHTQPGAPHDRAVG